MVFYVQRLCLSHSTTGPEGMQFYTIACVSMDAVVIEIYLIFLALN